MRAPPPSRHASPDVPRGGASRALGSPSLTPVLHLPAATPEVNEMITLQKAFETLKRAAACL